MKGKQFYIETYGCQMNFSDSEIVASILNQNGYTIETNPKNADIILINTCSIRQHAEDKIYNRLKHLHSLKKKNPNLKIGIIGCMAERLKENLFSLGVDIIAGPDSYRDIPKLIDNFTYEQNINTILSIEETYADITPLKINSNNITAFISIMRGCENFCSYCVVPYTRGKERSRDYNTIIHEASSLFNQGFREITLLGQNVNSYNYYEDDNVIDFPLLLEKVANINPNMRIRFATSHPKDISDKLIDTIAKYNNICKSIHLPVQSGSNYILERMNRKYTREKYLDIIKKIKSQIPDCSISTDIITGFPGETEDDHQQTIQLMNEVGFDFAYMFKYSQRENTLAAKKYIDDISEEIKTKRLNEIINIQQKLSLTSNKKDIGKTFEILVEGHSKKSTEKLYGRTSQNKVVIFDKKDFKPGDYVTVKITDCTSATLKGDIIN